MDEVKRYIVARSQAIEEGTVSTPCMAHEEVMVLAADHDRRCADLAADIATLGDGLQHAISIADGAEREAEALRAEVAQLRREASLYRFVRGLAWYVDQAASVYELGNSQSPWSSERQAVDADDVEEAIIAAMGGVHADRDTR